MDQNNELSIVSNVEITRNITPGISRAAETVCLEPNCFFRCSRIPELRIHLTKVHNLPQPFTSLQFDNLKDFECWLADIEREQCCTYMRRRGWQTNKTSKSTAYYCRRGGAYRSNASRKQSKMQGSCKTGVECTSSLKVKVNLEEQYRNLAKVEVEAYLKHYGHNAEMCHTRIPGNIKNDIAQKLSNGISRHKIIDEIRESFHGFTSVSRSHLISLQDIYNIERSVGITGSRGRYSSESGITAQTWIQSMQKSEDNPVLLIKYQQEKPQQTEIYLSDDDFLLILQTPLQSGLLQKHGPMQHVCIDIAHGNNNDNNKSTDDTEFYILAIEVLVETAGNIAQPVAWCVSNRSDDCIINSFFKKVSENMKGMTLTPSHVMTPCQYNNWFKIWTDVFGAGPRKLLASWHVHDIWINQFCKLCPTICNNVDEKGRITHNLEAVLYTPNSKQFVELLQQCTQDLTNTETTTDFGKYFIDKFGQQTEQWAQAYRPDNICDLSFKAFYTKMSKHIYHEGLKRKQLDVLIKTLMKYSRDNVLVKLRKTFLVSNAEQCRSLTNVCHQKSLTVSVHSVKRKDPCSWSLLLADINKHANTKKTLVQFDVDFTPELGCNARSRCPLYCRSCDVCSHVTSCSCSKSIEEVMCVHVHLLCIYLKKNKPNNWNTIFPTSSNTTNTNEDVVELEIVKDAEIQVKEEVCVGLESPEAYNPFTIIIQE